MSDNHSGRGCVGAGWGLVLAASLVLAAGLAGCGGAPVAATPLGNVRNREIDAKERAAQISVARQSVGESADGKAAWVQAMRDVVWETREAPNLRVAAFQALVNDSDPAIVEEGRAMGRLLLPRENARIVVVDLSRTAAQKGWKDYIPALIRSYSRPMPQRIDEQDRAERLAIRDLSGGRPVEEVVFEVFMNPPELAPTYGLDWSQRFRTDAWDLLARLDGEGTMRLKLLEQAGGAAGDEVVQTIRASVRELRAIPVTGEELTWAMRLRDPKIAANAAWWSEATSAIARVSDRGPLQMRHAEPVRWAARFRPELITRSREQLLADVRAAMKGRDLSPRSAEQASDIVPETVDHWASTLRWGDLLTVLVLLEQVQRPVSVSAWYQQAKMDRRDTTTEYGGVLAARALDQEWAVPTLFPPRPGQREGDNKFIASEDMIRSSDRSLAHYHFHAQEERNSAYAGPSPGDLIYSARHGRNCLVLTSLGEGAMGVDYYQPDGVVVDLGRIRVGAASANTSGRQ